MDRLRQAFLDGSFILDMRAQTVEELVHSAMSIIGVQGETPSEDRDRIEELLLERERTSPTALGHAVAVPHLYDDEIKEPVIFFVRLARPLNADAPDGIPVRFFVFLLGPHSAAESHLDTLAAVARLFSDEEFRYEATIAKTDKELLLALDHFESRHLQRTQTHDAPTTGPLAYNGIPFAAWFADIQRRAPHYASDFIDGINAKGVSSTLFLFFALIAPAVTFGGLWEKATDGRIGAVEMILATAVCGMLWSLFSGTPLTIIGGIGPMYVFTGVLFTLSEQVAPGAAMSVYALTGLWTGLFLVLLAVFEGSVLMKYFTRFSIEIFAALNTLIFIVGSVMWITGRFKAVYAVHEDSGGLYWIVDRFQSVIAGDAGPDTPHEQALLAFLLMVGTFYVSITLVSNRNSRYLSHWMREFFADFGPAISLFTLTAIAVFFFDFTKVGLDGLNTPREFGPTDSGRNWLVNPFAAPAWLWFATMIPAVFNTMLVFLDQNFCAAMVNDSKHHLQKGEAYHHDLAVSGGLIAGCSMFGLPWLIPATVRTEAHIRSLATMETTGSGDTRILHVQENRLSPFVIHLLIGCSLLLLPWFQYIPMAVLYGLFLYMGVVSLSSNRFFERVALWATDANLYPTTHYIRRVPNGMIHIYTLVQAVCLGVLWFVSKSTTLGLLFPFLIALLAPIRMLLGRFFAASYLEALDPKKEPRESDVVDLPDKVVEAAP